MLMEGNILDKYNIAILGAGFFGLRLALLFAKNKNKVAIFDKMHDGMQEASLINQARVHNGYHYPRSYQTALSSHFHYQRFCDEYRSCINNKFDKIYAIAKKNSFINSMQFETFCRNIDIPLKEIPKQIKGYFNDNLFDNIYTANEVAFDAVKIKELLLNELAKYPNVAFFFNTKVSSFKVSDNYVNITLYNNAETIYTEKLFNITYAGINYLLKHSNFEPIDFKLELVELMLMTPPKELENLGITIMDGPFFSTMPYPAFKCHSLTHVRYSPHLEWYENNKCFDPYSIINSRENYSNWIYTIKDAQRYIPILEKSTYLGSKYTIKALVSRNEFNDGRPIAIKTHLKDPLIVSVLGAKFDNIYDLEKYIADFL